jgi:hypothetical protein
MSFWDPVDRVDCVGRCSVAGNGFRERRQGWLADKSGPTSHMFIKSTGLIGLYDIIL